MHAEVVVEGDAVVEAAAVGMCSLEHRDFEARNS